MKKNKFLSRVFLIGGVFLSAGLCAMEEARCTNVFSDEAQIGRIALLLHSRDIEAVKNRAYALQDDFVFGEKDLRKSLVSEFDNVLKAMKEPGFELEGFDNRIVAACREIMKKGKEKNGASVACAVVGGSDSDSGSDSEEEVGESGSREVRVAESVAYESGGLGRYDSSSGEADDVRPPIPQKVMRLIPRGNPVQRAQGDQLERIMECMRLLECADNLQRAKEILAVSHGKEIVDAALAQLDQIREQRLASFGRGPRRTRRTPPPSDDDDGDEGDAVVEVVQEPPAGTLGSFAVGAGGELYDEGPDAVEYQRPGVDASGQIIQLQPKPFLPLRIFSWFYNGISSGIASGYSKGVGFIKSIFRIFSRRSEPDLDAEV